eukprot:5420487-Amphidinium_carterae.1
MDEDPSQWSCAIHEQRPSLHQQVSDRTASGLYEQCDRQRNYSPARKNYRVNFSNLHKSYSSI